METKVLTHRRYQPKSYVIGALLTLWSSSIGKKAVMSLTGIAMMSFVLMHTYGTLKIFKGEQAFNDYAVWLREVGSPLLSYGMALWITRIGLLGAVSLHMLAAWLVTRRSWAARPTRYQEVEPLQSTFASRTIRWGGVVIALFVVYHILHFTFGAVGYGAGQYSSTSVYRHVVVGFSVWYVSAFYIVAQLFLGLHWYHGGWSILHTLGVATVGDRDMRQWVA
jgi:succinate dehydrogenase / fumarate reductase cytochrome b subunit